MQPEKFRTLLQFYPLITSFSPKNFSEKANFIGHKTTRDKLVLLVHRATSRICKRIAVFFVWMIATKRNGINALHRFTFALHSNDVFEGV